MRSSERLPARYNQELQPRETGRPLGRPSSGFIHGCCLVSINSSASASLSLRFLFSTNQEFLSDLVGAVLRLDLGTSEDEASVSVDGTSDGYRHYLDDDDDGDDMECLGVLASLHLAELDYARILTELNLLPRLEQVLTNDSSRHQIPCVQSSTH